MPGMVLLNIVGPPLGKTAVVPETFPEWNCNQAIAFFRFISDVLPEYIHAYFRAGLFLKNIDLIGTAGQDNISVTKCKNIVIPLPPLAEQRRIVGKVDQLLGLCDELAARQAARREARSALVGATLDRLVSPRRQPNSSSPSPQSSGERGAGGEGVNRLKRRPPHSQPFSPVAGGEGSKDMDSNRLRDHFDRLFDTPTTIPQLRQAILQLAVQGQLVPQDPRDEPASVLQSKIHTKRKRLIESGEFTAFATDTEWPDGALPYSLPDGWEWIRFGELGGFLGGGTPSKDRAEFWDGKIPWVSPKDMKRPYMEDAIDHVSPLGVENSSGKMIPKGSLMISLR